VSGAPAVVSAGTRYSWQMRSAVLSWWRWVGLAFVLAAGLVLGGTGLLPASGSRAHGWVVAPTTHDGSALIHHLPANSGWGALRPAVRLVLPPDAIAAYRDELVVVLPRTMQKDAPAVLGVRSYQVRGARGGEWEYSRPRVLPPIPLWIDAGSPQRAIAPENTGEDEPFTDPADAAGASGEPSTMTLDRLAGLAVAGGAGPDGRLLVALLESAQQPGPRALLALSHEGWAPVAMPPDLSAASPVWLAGSEGSIVLAQRVSPEPGEPSGMLRVWSIGAGELLGDRPAWSSWRCAVPMGNFRLLGVDGYLVLVTGAHSDGQRRLIELRPSGPREIGTLPTTAGARTGVLGLGEGGGAAVVAVSLPIESGAGRQEIIATALSGQRLHDGPTTGAGPVTVGQVGMLALGLLSLFFSILVFIVRPESTWNPQVLLPPGASLAPPGRRLLAYVFDLAPGMFVSTLVFPGGAGTGWLASFGGVAPMAFVMLVTCCHMAIMEATAGTTPGKLVLGLRTIDVGGGRPSARQAVLRSIVKVLCPPLMLFTLTNPYMPGPAGFGTVVIADDVSPDGPGGPSRHDEPDEGDGPLGSA
jgi:uncharacterized RDD family membrane protein YckC